jgi:hypothetical protein
VNLYFVDKLGLHVLLSDTRATSHGDVPVASGCFGPFEGAFDTVLDEDERLLIDSSITSASPADTLPEGGKNQSWRPPDSSFGPAMKPSSDVPYLNNFCHDVFF